MMANSSLSFPSFESLDHNTLCPIFTELVGTELEASRLSMEQLEPLGEELQTLYNSVSEKISNLLKETEVLTEWTEVKRCERAQSDEPSDSSTKSSEKPFTRCLRDTPCRSENNSPAPSRSKVKQVRPQPLNLETLGRVPKSDAPEKFWAIVEPYCADITADDMKTLEELMTSHDDDLDYYKIPSIGKHYSQKWLQEDMEQEKKEGAKFMEKKKSLAGQKRRLDSAGETSNSSMSTDDTNAKTPPSSSDDVEESPFGPLTQRLVSALIDENIISSSSSSGISAALPDTDSYNSSPIPDGEMINDITPHALAKQLNISNTAQLEKRIRRELEEQGIIESEEVGENEEGDEILMELRQKQQELKAVGEYNLGMTKRLYKLAKEEMSRQDLRRRLAAVDADVIEAYRRVQQARQKKRAPTKREKDSVMRALKERDALVKQIESHGSY